MSSAGFQQPSKRLSSTGLVLITDYTTFINPFIGTDNYGDVCPGASVPFGMVKITTDMTGYAPAGYVTDNTQFVRGLSPLHDSGTGSSLGSYGNFEIMPLICPGGFNTCTPNLAGREHLRMDNTDDASPGYFSLTLNNSIRMEATSTRRAGLERFAFPKGNTPFFTLDLSNDLPHSFKGGNMTIDPRPGRITIGGFWGSSFGPGRSNTKRSHVTISTMAHRNWINSASGPRTRTATSYEDLAKHNSYSRVVLLVT